MRSFIFKSVVFIVPLVVFFSGICFLADGYTDQFYVRLTTQKQKNFIIGTSRAAQGLQPEVINKILDTDIYNYAFSVGHSPFGKVYFESIIKKHNKESNGIFIIEVTPWSISSWCEDPNDLTQFRENSLCLGNTKCVSLNPNFEYLYKNLKGRYKDIILPPSKNMFLHTNGWLEIKGIEMDSVSVNKRISNTLEIYKTKPKTKISNVRLDYLLQTIKYLKKYGDVYLVRLPIHSSMIEIEDKIIPNFNSVIKDAIALSDKYLDLTPHNDEYTYTDGSHLYKSSGKEVSELIANWIKR